MEREGLGRGIEDISHLFLTPRSKRQAGEASPKTHGPQSAAAAVWPVVRAGDPLPLPATVWQMAWRLAPLGTQTLFIAPRAEVTEVRWLGQSQAPPADAAADLLDRADAAVIDLTDAPNGVAQQIALAAGQLVVLAEANDSGPLAAYAVIKRTHDALPNVSLGLEILGRAEDAEAARVRLNDAARHFLKTPLIDWRERYLSSNADAGGPEPPVCATWPTESVIGALCALASRGQQPSAAPRCAERQRAAAVVESNSGAPAQRRAGCACRPLLAWPDPDPNELADFVQHHPHLVQSDLVVVDRGLHQAGEDVVDLLGMDDSGRPTIVLVSASGGAPLLADGLGYVRWCLREAVLIRRLHAGLRLDPATPPRLVLAACRFDDDLLEAARAVTRPAVSLFELRAYELAGERAVAVARVA